MVFITPYPSQCARKGLSGTYNSLEGPVGNQKVTETPT